LKKNYKLQFLVSERAFRETGLEQELSRPITPPKVDQVPLSEYLQQILTQIKATYQILDDTILILPAVGAKKGP
jgi:hypothetical protein